MGNDHQKSRFAKKIVKGLFNTITDKKVAMFGFAFKKDTGDTRESPAIYVSKHLIEEGAKLSIYDPKVAVDQVRLDLSIHRGDVWNKEMFPINAKALRKSFSINPYQQEEQFMVVDDPYECAKKAHVIVVCTEWDEFKNYDYQKIYDSMEKPAFIFDGRKILNHKKLIEIGFKVHTIGANPHNENY